MYRRISVPLDGSSTSERALQEALQIGKDTQAQLLLLHVLEDTPLWNTEGYLDVVSIEGALRDSGEDILERAAAQARAAGVAAETTLIPAHGHRVARVIVDESDRWGAEVIVMGTHGRRGFDHLLFGSVAEGVVRMATRPILLIRAR